MRIGASKQFSHTLRIRKVSETISQLSVLTEVREYVGVINCSLVRELESVTASAPKRKRTKVVFGGNPTRKHTISVTNCSIKSRSICPVVGTTFTSIIGSPFTELTHLLRGHSCNHVLVPLSRSVSNSLTHTRCRTFTTRGRTTRSSNTTSTTSYWGLNVQ